MKFEWDVEKNSCNKAKHGISFETAALIFNDKNRIEIFDSKHSSDTEDRYITIGKAGTILFVVYTERKDITRIISARLANKDERKAYYGKYYL